MEIETGKPGGATLCVRGLTKRYWFRNTVWKRTTLTAIQDVSFEIPPGRTLGLVGASGCGKSTLARCVTRLECPDAGEIWLNGTDIAPIRSRGLLPYRAQMQMIFQDPLTAMNLRMSAAEIIEEPLLILRRGTRQDRRTHAAEMMREAGLSPDWLDRRITEFSGGQRQRLAIARALVLSPKLLILDEALSGLDLSTQAQIANLLLDLQSAHGLTYILIAHDLSLVARLADMIAVMSAGKIVEQGPVHRVISQPVHPATQSLLKATRGLPFTSAAAGGAR